MIIIIIWTTACGQRFCLFIYSNAFFKFQVKKNKEKHFFFKTREKEIKSICQLSSVKIFSVIIDANVDGGGSWPR